MNGIGTDSEISKEKHIGRQSIYLAIIILAAFFLRFYRLGDESLWIDEGFSMRDATNFSFLGETRPLYFFILSWWLKLGGGQNEFMLRLPAAMFGAFSVWLFYIIGRRLLGTSVALLASAFMAVSVLQINHSQEVRMYSLNVLLSLVATYLLILAMERRKTGYVLGYMVTAMAGLLTYPLWMMILAAHGLFLLFYAKAYRPTSYVMIGAQIAVMAAWLPWLLNNMGASVGYGEGITSILEKPTPLGVAAIMGKFYLWKWFNPGKMMGMFTTVFSLFVSGVALYGIKGFRRTDTGLAFVWLWLAIPVAGMIVYSYAINNVWMVHYMIASSPALFLLVSRGILSTRRRYVAVVLAMLIFMPTMGRLWMYYSKHARPEWRAAVSYIETHERPGDVVGLYYAGNQYVFRYYYHGKSKWSPVGSDDIVKGHFGPWDDGKVNKLLASYPLSGQRFWLVLCSHSYAGGPEIVKYLSEHYKILDHQLYTQIEVLLLDRKDGPVPFEPMPARDSVINTKHDKEGIVSGASNPDKT